MSLARSAATLHVLPAASARAGIDAFSLDVHSAARIIDHTLLRADATRKDLEQLCDEARQFGFWSVCVNPAYVPLAVTRLRGSGVRVTTVIGFPLGATLTTVKRFEASEVLRQGAAELDMVLNLGALKSGDNDIVRADIRGVAELCHAAGGLLKVILETALLTQSEKTLACELALAAGADFVKTSTSYADGGATTADVLLLRRVVGDRMGVKAAGAIRTLEQFRALVAAGANRIGTSSGPAILREFT